jgi:hypothetical protein
MDPHSRLTQFNQRTPKALNARQMDSLFHPKAPILDRFPRKSDAGSSSRSRGRKASVSLSSSSSVLLDGPSRPIATNSRIKQDERFRKDMYLAFVHNALHQKALVRVSCSSIRYLTRAVGQSRAVRRARRPIQCQKVGLRRACAFADPTAPLVASGTYACRLAP